VLKKSGLANNNSMDAPEDDQDVKLQRASDELLADLQHSLDPFLWKATPSGKRKIRRRVRVRETDRLISLVLFPSISSQTVLIHTRSWNLSKRTHNSSTLICKL
jgi:hypothetical protein